MKRVAFEHLACPRCKAPFRLEVLASPEDSVRTAWLECSSCKAAVPVVRGFPLFSAIENRLPRESLAALEDLDRRVFDKGGPYRKFLRAKERRPTPDAYAAFQPFNEATRAIDPLIEFLRDYLEPNSLIIDLWCRTGWTGEMLAALFPTQHVISLWGVDSDVLGFRGFDFWFGESKRRGNWDIVFSSPHGPLPFGDASAALLHGFDMFHRFPQPPLVAECLRVAGAAGLLLFPHVHLTNAEPVPFFARGETRRHGRVYRRYFDRLLKRDPRCAFILSEKTLYENDTLILHDESDTDHYNACLLIAPRDATGARLMRTHNISAEDRIVVNPLFAQSVTQREIAISKDALFGKAGAVLERHPMLERRLQATGSTQLTPAERSVLYEAGCGRTVEDMALSPEAVTSLETRQIVRALPVSEASVRLQHYFARQQYIEREADVHLASVWRAALEDHADANFINWPAERSTFTYAEVDRASRMVASLLIDAGIVTGDRVVITGIAHPEFCFVFWGAVRLGVVVVPVDPALDRDEISAITRRVDARMLFTFAHADVDVPGCRQVRLGDGSAIAAHVPLDITTLPASEDPAVVLFTSGTTGHPKGVVLSHGSLFRSSRTMARHYDLRERDVLLFAGGLHVMSGLRNVCVLPVGIGASVVLQDSFDVSPLALAQVCQRERVTILSTAPGFLSYIVRAGDRAVRLIAGATLRKILCTGSRLPPQDRRDVEQRLSVAVHDYYGLTETGGACLFGTDSDRLGVPVDCLATVFDPQGNEVADGETGELGIASRNLMLGYIDDVGGAQARYRGGHLLTGDLVRRGMDGELKLLGRRDRLIAEPSGTNLYPEAIEDALRALDTVADCYVARIVDERGHERAVAFVEPNASPLLESREWQRLIRQVARREVECIPSLPRRTDGSIDNDALAEFIPGAAETDG